MCIDRYRIDFLICLNEIHLLFVSTSKNCFRISLFIVSVNKVIDITCWVFDFLVDFFSFIYFERPDGAVISL